MRTIRVFVDGVLIPGQELRLDPRPAHHVIRVLRRRAGDRLILFDGCGTEAEATIERAHRRHGCSVLVESVSTVDREPPLAVELIPSVARGEKMDLVVQKSTELGVAAIRPVLTERSEVRSDSASRRLARWREIAINACEQCGRTVLPAIHAAVALDDLECSAARRIVLVPDAITGVGELGLNERAVAVALGPEGGLDSSDMESLAGKRFQPVGFGPRVLRTETAAIAILAALQHRYGDL
jgi:16S rRNA (uracil1498-N3)-methyltransferase